MAKLGMRMIVGNNGVGFVHGDDLTQTMFQQVELGAEICAIQIGRRYTKSFDIPKEATAFRFNTSESGATMVWMDRDENEHVGQFLPWLIAAPSSS